MIKLSINIKIDKLKELKFFIDYINILNLNKRSGVNLKLTIKTRYNNNLPSMSAVFTLISFIYFITKQSPKTNRSCTLYSTYFLHT